MSNIIKIGDVYGDYVVVSDDGYLEYQCGQRAKRFLCRCKMCGKNKSILVSDMMQKHGVKCTCRKLDMSYIGKKFTLLTIIDMYLTDSGKVMCRCHCECGKDIELPFSRVKSGHNKSCGCYKTSRRLNRINYIGKRFGRLTVIGDADDCVLSNGHHMRMLRCVCDCGNECIVSQPNLTYGSSQSCGCFQREKASRDYRATLTYEIVGDVAHVKTDRNVEFIIDAEDVDKVSEYSWVIHNGYIRSRDVGLLSRFLMSCNNNDYVVDHINRNKLDNRKSNLRICTRTENNMNKSPRSAPYGISGVYNTDNGKYRAMIGSKNKTTMLGTYDNLEDAIVARLSAEHKLFGEYAPNKNLFAEYGICDDVIK